MHAAGALPLPQVPRDHAAGTRGLGLLSRRPENVGGPSWRHLTLAVVALLGGGCASATHFEIVDEAKRVGMDVAGHTPFSIRSSEASAAGQRSVEHMGGVALECSDAAERLFAIGHSEDALEREILDTFSEQRAAELGRTFRVNDTWMVPTLCLWLPWMAHDVGELERMPGFDQVPAYERDEWAQMRAYLAHERTEQEESLTRRRFARELATIAILRGQGVRFLAGTDVGNEYILPGYSLHDELELFVQAGFTPVAALRTATSDAADYMHASDEIGQVAPGMFADLVLLDANPLADIRNTRRVSAVILNGRVVEP